MPENGPRAATTQIPGRVTRPERSAIKPTTTADQNKHSQPIKIATCDGWPTTGTIDGQTRRERSERWPSIRNRTQCSRTDRVMARLHRIDVARIRRPVGARRCSSWKPHGWIITCPRRVPERMHSTLCPVALASAALSQSFRHDEISESRVSPIRLPRPGELPGCNDRYARGPCPCVGPARRAQVERWEPIELGAFAPAQGASSRAHGDGAAPLANRARFFTRKTKSVATEPSFGRKRPRRFLVD